MEMEEGFGAGVLNREHREVGVNLTEIHCTYVIANISKVTHT